MVAQLHDVPGDHSESIIVPLHAAATVTEAVPIFRAPFACTITSVHVTPAAAATGDNTNTTNINLLNGGAAGTGTTELGNLDYATGTNAAVGVTQTVYAPANPDDGVELAAGSVLKLQFEKIGTGLAIGANLVSIKYRGA